MTDEIKAEVRCTQDEPFITKVEVAKRLNKKSRTVDNWMQRGLLPYYKIGRSVAFKWSEVETHLSQTCRVCLKTR
jgi:excisionase family DNA binding protein